MARRAAESLTAARQAMTDSGLLKIGIIGDGGRCPVLFHADPGGDLGSRRLGRCGRLARLRPVAGAAALRRPHVLRAPASTLGMIELRSTITCPQCGHRQTETMPTDACQFFYDCRGCAAVLRPNRAIAASTAATARFLARRSKRVAAAAPRDAVGRLGRCQQPLSRAK